MVEIKSTTQRINLAIEDVYAYLSKPSNYKILMPEKVRDFQAFENNAILDIQGLGKVDLGFAEKRPPEYIELKPNNKVPFNFNLVWNLERLDDQTTNATATINAQLNFMMRMMAEKTLKEFLEVQVQKLAQHLNA
jgi:hypothetical protein